MWTICCCSVRGTGSSNTPTSHSPWQTVLRLSSCGSAAWSGRSPSTGTSSRPVFRSSPEIASRPDRLAASVRTERAQRNRRSTARQSYNQLQEYRIMAGQNHCWQNHKRRGGMNLPNMILACHDSVGPLRLNHTSSQLENNLDCFSAERGRGRPNQPPPHEPKEHPTANIERPTPNTYRP